MQQLITVDRSESFPYLNPEIRVHAGGFDIGTKVSRLGVVSDLREKADTCVVMVSDIGQGLEKELNRGKPLSISRGYAGDVLTEIFRGVIREVGNTGQIVIRGIDWNVLLNSQRINATFQEETISGLVKAVLFWGGF